MIDEDVQPEGGVNGRWLGLRRRVQGPSRCAETVRASELGAQLVSCWTMRTSGIKMRTFLEFLEAGAAQDSRYTISVCVHHGVRSTGILHLAPDHRYCGCRPSRGPEPSFADFSVCASCLRRVACLQRLRGRLERRLRPRPR